MGTLVSFPKSGRTWLVVMLDQLDVKMVNTHAGSEYVIGCHHYDLPKPKAKAGPGKQLFLLRDPRDTVISGYFQKTKRNTSNNYPGSIAQFIRDPRYGIEKIIYFNLTWLESYFEMADQNHRAISYEQLRAQPVESLSAIYAFIAGREHASPRLIANVVESTSFSKMHAQERNGELGTRYGATLTPGDPSDPESMKVRKGKVGGYVDYMTEDDIHFCNSILEHYRYEERIYKCSPVFLYQPASQHNHSGRGDFDRDASGNQ